MERLRTIVGSLLVTSLLVTTACLAAYASAPIDHTGAGCPLMGHDAATCAANSFVHTSMEQLADTAIPAGVLLLTVILLTLVLRGRVVLRIISPRPPPASWSPRVAEPFPAHPLQYFITRGLLHPKVY